MLLVILLHLLNVGAFSEIIKSSIFQDKTVVITTNSTIKAICLDPEDDDTLYGVVNHGLLKLNTATGRHSLAYGSYTEAQTIDSSPGTHDSPRFNNPSCCTPFGSVLAVGQIGEDQNAIRLIAVGGNVNVSTLVDQGNGGEDDGEFFPGTGSGAGVQDIVYLEAVNSTHLVACSIEGTVRLIDTNKSTIITIVPVIISSPADEVSITYYVIM